MPGIPKDKVQEYIFNNLAPDAENNVHVASGGGFRAMILAAGFFRGTQELRKEWTKNNPDMDQKYNPYSPGVHLAISGSSWFQTIFNYAVKRQNGGDGNYTILPYTDDEILGTDYNLETQAGFYEMSMLIATVLDFQDGNFHNEDYFKNISEAVRNSNAFQELPKEDDSYLASIEKSWEDETKKIKGTGDKELCNEVEKLSRLRWSDYGRRGMRNQLEWRKLCADKQMGLVRSLLAPSLSWASFRMTRNLQEVLITAYNALTFWNWQRSLHKILFSEWGITCKGQVFNRTDIKNSSAIDAGDVTSTEAESNNFWRGNKTNRRDEKEPLPYAACLSAVIRDNNWAGPSDLSATGNFCFSSKSFFKTLWLRRKMKFYKKMGWKVKDEGSYLKMFELGPLHRGQLHHDSLEMKAAGEGFLDPVNWSANSSLPMSVAWTNILGHNAAHAETVELRENPSDTHKTVLNVGVGDGGNVDGVGIVSAVARGAKNIVSLVFTGGEWDPVGARKAGKSLDAVVEKYRARLDDPEQAPSVEDPEKGKPLRDEIEHEFGSYFPRGIRELWGLANDEIGQIHRFNRVFNLDDMQPFLQKLTYNHEENGKGLVATHEVTTVENKHYGIEAGQKVTVTFVMLPAKAAAKKIAPKKFAQKAEALVDIVTPLVSVAPGWKQVFGFAWAETKTHDSIRETLKDHGALQVSVFEGSAPVMAQALLAQNMANWMVRENREHFNFCPKIRKALAADAPPEGWYEAWMMKELAEVSK